MNATVVGIVLSVEFRFICMVPVVDAFADISVFGIDSATGLAPCWMVGGVPLAG